MELYLLTGLIGVFLPTVLYAESFEKKTAEYNINYYKTGTTTVALHFKCARGFRLADIEVLAGASVFNSDCKRNVYGKTSDLIADVNKCHWKRSCTIKFPKRRMVTCSTLKTDSKRTIVSEIWELHVCSCILREVEFLRPVRAVCVNKQSIHTLWKVQEDRPKQCHEGNNHLPRRRKEMEGLIKSHEDLPWYYGAGVVKESFCLKIPVKKHLVIGVNFVDLCEFDSLELITKHRTIKLAEAKATRHFTFRRRKDEYVQIKFSTGENTPGCGGFEICYKAVMAKNRKPYDGLQKHVCDDLYMKSNLTLHIRKKKY